MRFVGRTGRILICALVRVTIIGLRMCLRPLRDLILVYPHLTVFYPSAEFRQCFAVFVFADTGVDSIVPTVDTADEIVAIHMPVGHQRTTMSAASVQHADGIVIADNDQVNVRNQRRCRCSILKFVPICNANFFHSVVVLS